MFEADGVTILPSCCGDLGATLEWKRFLATGEIPWAGHDPAPWATYEGDVIMIWSDGGTGEQGIEPSIRTTREEFGEQLALACDQLIEFGTMCLPWLIAQEVPQAKAIHARIMRDFQRQLDS